MTTQPELPEAAEAAALLPSRHLRLAPAAPDVDFDGFVRSYEVRLRRLVMRRIGDLCEAEEITQETLLRAYQHRASFASEDELMAWSTVVAQRLVIDRVRVRGRSIAVADVPETGRVGRDTADVVVARHEARAALESLEAIPTRQAAILWAREVEGLHYEEIAERFGISEPAVRSLLHRGRKALRAEFKSRTGSLPLNGLAPFAPWLIALKAASKVRVAAKTVGKSPAVAVATLSLTGLVAIGIGGGFNGRTAEATGVAIKPSYGVSTDSAPRFEAPEGALRIARSAQLAPGRAPDRSDPPADRHPIMTPEVDECIGGRVRTSGGQLCTASNEPWSGATIQIGPDLPSNPTGMKNIKVSIDPMRCTDTHLPDSGPVHCEDNASTSGGPNPLDPHKPSLEGASR